MIFLTVRWCKYMPASCWKNIHKNFTQNRKKRHVLHTNNEAKATQYRQEAKTFPLFNMSLTTHAGRSRCMARDQLCLWLHPHSNRKMAWGINTKLGTYAKVLPYGYGRTLACIVCCCADMVLFVIVHWVVTLESAVKTGMIWSLFSAPTPQLITGIGSFL